MHLQGAPSSAARALYEIFVTSVPSSTVHTTKLRPQSSISRLASAPYNNSQRRYYAYKNASNDEKPKIIYDYGITASHIAIVDEKGGFHPPIPLAQARKSYDPFYYRLVQVTKPESDQDTTCKLMAQDEFLKLVRDMSKPPKNKIKNMGTQPAKQIELNWAIAEGDLKHRLDSMQLFLEKGRRVEIILAPKRRGKRATEQQGLDVVEAIRRKLGDVDGAKEWKPMSGDILGTATMFVERKGGKRSEEEVEDEEEEDDD